MWVGFGLKRRSIDRWWWDVDTFQIYWVCVWNDFPDFDDVGSVGFVSWLDDVA